MESINPAAEVLKPDKEFKKEMESKEDRWWRGGEYKPKVLEEDLKKLEDLYRNEGFLDAKENGFGGEQSFLRLYRFAKRIAAKFGGGRHQV